MDVRTTTGTNVAGKLTLSSISKTGTLPEVMEYKIVSVADGTTCNSGVFGSGASYVAGSFGTLTANYVTVGATPTVPSVVQTDIAAAGAVVRYCFDVRLKSDAATSYQNGTGTVTWGITGTSVS
jgi:hypothetical protein